MWDAVDVCDVLPFGYKVDVFRAIWKRHTFWNHNLCAAAEIFVDTKFPIHFAVLHTVSILASGVPIHRSCQFSVL
jgi:hypothetical protein